MIGDDKILCTKLPAIVELYDLPESNYTHVEDILRMPPSAPAHDPIWSHTFSSDGRMYCSPLYHDGAMHRCVVSTNKGIWGLVFPATGDTPSIIQLSTFSNRRAICVPGVRKALALYGDGTSDVKIGYSWDDEEGGRPPMRYINGTPKSSPFYGRQSAFDEENGRFLWRDMETIMVVDFLRKVSGNLITRKGTD